jgi:hypothetical protein
MESKAIVISGERQVKNARILILRAALKLEIRGLRRKGESVYSIAKREFGFTGNRDTVLEGMNAWIKNNISPNL